jgi:membrane-bound inhibitor of C-type lysozyme
MGTRTSIAAFLALVVLGAVTPASRADEARRITASFVCDGGRTIGAVFTAGTPGSVELHLSDGRRLVLPQTISASGARYANADESVIFWNKGRTAFIEEAGHQTYSGCVQSEPHGNAP